jgi:methylglutaconyl-CoA hydratase
MGVSEQQPTGELATTAANGVVRLTLNRPRKRNALTRELLKELHSAILEAAGRTDLRCLVLEAAGPVFCAGMDLAQMEETASRKDARHLWHSDTQRYHDVVAAIMALPAPTIAVVQGPALAGGVGLVLACDLVLASESATFALPEPKRGITAAIVTPLLVHRVGVSAASWLLLSGEGMDSARAREMGLCHEIVAAADLGAARDRLIASVLSGAPGALAISKQQLLSCNAEVLKQLSSAVIVSAQARETPEAREGLAAFLEKRPPAWQPK